MAHKARAASFPPNRPTPPSPSPTGTTASATFPPLPPPHCRWLQSHSTAAARPSSSSFPLCRRARHLRRHFCRWCKLFHVDASSRWRRRGRDGRRKPSPLAAPAPRPLSPLCTFPFSHATASRRAEPRSDGAARRAGSGEVVAGARSPRRRPRRRPSSPRLSCCGSSKNEKEIVLLARSLFSCLLFPRL